MYHIHANLCELINVVLIVQGRYIEDMKMQFDKCQEFEHTRMDFFKETLQNFQQVLDLSQDER